MAEFLTTIPNLEGRANYADWADRVERALRLAGWWEATQFKPLAKSSMSSSALASYKEWERSQSTLEEGDSPSSDIDIMDWTSELEPVPGCRLSNHEVLVHHPRNSQALLAIKAALADQVNERYPGFKSASRLWQAIAIDCGTQPTTPTQKAMAVSTAREDESTANEEEDSDEYSYDSDDSEAPIVPENSPIRRYGAGGPVGFFLTVSELYHAMSWSQMISAKKLSGWAYRAGRDPTYVLGGSHKLLNSLQEPAFGEEVTKIMELQDRVAEAKTTRARLGKTWAV